ncbi:hypothetical protein [Pseudomonas sp. TH31]|uniref:hypothetical protein n=1 Tax=Pseudomonas sp. TH31 TaxID=2796396 RepID=UPI001F5B72F5|nr:hypothetical protein [Pseudomonas sp. TH31]
MLQQAHAFVPVGAMHHLELLITKMQADQVGDVQIVLDHQDAFGLFHEAQSFAANGHIVRVFLRGSYHELFNFP